MYSKLICAIIRPGIGTVTKCLFFKSKIFAISETNNYEISFNAKQISKFKVGHDYSNLYDALNDAKKYASRISHKYIFEDNFQQINFDGANQAMVYILENRSI